MSDVNGAESGTTAPTESGDAGHQTETVTVNRSAEELTKKLVEVSAENKKFRQKATTTAQLLEERERELNSLKEEKLKEQGQWQKMFETERAERLKLEEQTKRDRANFAYKTVTSVVASEAVKAGCAKVDDLIKLATADGLISDLEVSNEDFTVTQESLKVMLDKAVKSYPYLFGKSTPTIRDGVPSQTKTQRPNGKDLSTMKMDELIAMAKQTQ